MRTLDEVMGRCYIDDAGHWIWRGAKYQNGPRIHAPTLPSGEMQSQHGRKAVWQMKTGRPVPEGWRVYGTCDQPLCVNPECTACGPSNAVGRHIAKTGKFKNKPQRILANRAIGRKRAMYTPEQLALVLASDETHIALSRQLGLGRTTIARMRSGEARAFVPIGGIFSGIINSGATT